MPFAQWLLGVNAPFCAAPARRNRPPAGSLCAWKRILWKMATECALLVHVIHRAIAHFWPTLGARAQGGLLAANHTLPQWRGSYPKTRCWVHAPTLPAKTAPPGLLHPACSADGSLYWLCRCRNRASVSSSAVLNAIGSSGVNSTRRIWPVLLSSTTCSRMCAW